MGRFSTQYETRSLAVGMLLCNPHGWGLSLLYFPSGRSVNTLPQTCAYMSILSMRKKTSVGCNVTCRHLLEHLDSWIPTPHWGVHGNQRHSGGISAMPFRKTACARAECCSILLTLACIPAILQCFSMFHVSRLQNLDLIGNVRYGHHVFVQKKEETGEKGNYTVCGCVHMHQNVCISKWLISCTNGSKGRHRERSNNTVPNRPVGSCLGQACLHIVMWVWVFCPCFPVDWNKPMYYSLVSQGNKWETSIWEAVQYSPVLTSFNPMTAGQVIKLVGKA